MTLQLNNATNNVQIDFDAGAGTNRTVTFPDASGTVALEGAAGGLGGNISRATIFRLNSDFDTNDTGITGWEIPDETGETGGVGGAVTTIGDGSIFQFPVTGIWMVQFTGTLNIGTGDAQASISTVITTDNGGAWNTRAQAIAGSTPDNNQN